MILSNRIGALATGSLVSAVSPTEKALLEITCASPFSPLSPLSPRAPLPNSPFCPSGPVGSPSSPLFPFRPMGPWTPWGPIFPGGPRSPLSPLFPLSPAGPMPPVNNNQTITPSVQCNSNQCCYSVVHTKSQIKVNKHIYELH
uniref:Uncharacterized protein n=1 Tax=Scophthalmus maximus TaxID=52904 RepID=A0A8D3AV70_SCOMX